MACGFNSRPRHIAPIRFLLSQMSDKFAELTGYTIEDYIPMLWDKAFPEFHSSQLGHFIDASLPSIPNLVFNETDRRVVTPLTIGNPRNIQVMEIIIMINQMLGDGLHVVISRGFKPSDTKMSPELIKNAHTTIRSINPDDISFIGEDRDWPTARAPRNLISFFSASNLDTVSLTPIPQQPPDSRQ